MNLKILNSREKKKIFEMIKGQFGFMGSLDGVFLLSPKHELFYLSDGFSILESNDDKKLRIKRAGLHIADVEKDSVWLTVEGTHLIGSYCSKNVITLDDSYLEPWLRGEDFKIDAGVDDCFVILKHKDDFLGCALLKKGVVKNYLSKSRTLKNVNM